MSGAALVLADPPDGLRPALRALASSSVEFEQALAGTGAALDAELIGFARALWHAIAVFRTWGAASDPPSTN